MTLTEQWKKGELPSRDDEHEWLSYYIKHNDGYIHADSYWRGKWGIADRNSIAEVLAPVPSYEELQQLKEDNRLFEDKIQNSYQKIGKLRQLLKECQQTNKVLVGVMDWLKVSAVPEQRDMCAKLSIGVKDLMNKIDEVMK